MTELTNLGEIPGQTPPPKNTAPAIDQIRGLGTQILEELEKTGDLLVQSGKLVLPETTTVMVTSLASMTRAEPGVEHDNRIIALGQYEKVVGMIGARLVYCQHYNHYRGKDLEEMEAIIAHNSEIGNQLLGVFVDNMTDPDSYVSLSAIDNFRKAEPRWGIHNGSGVTLSSDLIGRAVGAITEKINARAPGFGPGEDRYGGTSPAYDVLSMLGSPYSFKK